MGRFPNSGMFVEGLSDKKTKPQGLKPVFLICLNSTTKVVPCYESQLGTPTSAPGRFRYSPASSCVLRTDSPPGHVGRGNEETCGLDLVERARQGSQSCPGVAQPGAGHPGFTCRVNAGKFGQTSVPGSFRSILTSRACHLPDAPPSSFALCRSKCPRMRLSPGKMANQSSVWWFSSMIVSTAWCKYPRCVLPVMS